MHEVPGQALEEAILGEDADVLREIGVVNAAGLEIEHLAREERGETDRAGRADDDLGKVFALDVIEHLEDGREAELL